MNRDDAEEFTQGLAQIVAGSWRQVALAKKLSVPKALGLTVEEWVNGRLGGYIRYSIAERREAVMELATQGESNRSIAQIVGIDESTVRDDRRAGNPARAGQEAQEISGHDDKGAGNPAPIDAVAALAADEKIRAAAAATERQGDKAQRRADREVALGAKQLALPLKRYGVVYADPPWSFKPYSVETGMDRAADNHYPTMDTAAIRALEVPAADDAVLFLWATSPMLLEALEVLLAWGFVYKSHFVWEKDKIGTGYWNRNKHELLLVGTRGSIPAPAPGEQYESLIKAPRGAHSAKPFTFREMIEEMFPTLPRIELFARERFEGWDAWGNEADGRDQAAQASPAAEPAGVGGAVGRLRIHSDQGA